MKTETKKELLVKAAASRFYRFGLSASTIADVAADAGVPPGNVYYYFRTKDALAVAVQDYRQRRTTDSFDEIDARHGDAPSRILDYLERSRRNASTYAQSGCPIAALSRDFRNGSPTLQALAGRIFKRQLDWLEAQFAAIGLPKRASESASLAILTAIQGGIGLAYATNSLTPIRASVSDAKERVTALVAAYC